MSIGHGALVPEVWPQSIALSFGPGTLARDFWCLVNINC